MKSSVLIVALMAAVMTSARAATPATFTHRHRGPESHRAPAVTQGEVTGVIPRAIRGGHPLQMLNPYAPAKYGSAEQNVVLDPDVPGKLDGIKLFSITF